MTCVNIYKENNVSYEDWDRRYHQYHSNTDMFVESFRTDVIICNMLTYLMSYWLVVSESVHQITDKVNYPSRIIYYISTSYFISQNLVFSLTLKNTPTIHST